MGNLFKAVFSGTLLSQLRKSLDSSEKRGKGLRIRLRLNNAPALAALPWEFLYDEEQDHFLTTSELTPLVRYPELSQIVSPLRVSLPLRVLVVIALPRNLNHLRAEEEREKLKRSLSRMKTAGRRRAARGEPFHILHFIGHGGFDKVVEDGVLHFEDATGMSDPIQGYLLGNTLRDHTSLRLAVLNACEGARQSVEDPFSGVAQSLCRQRLPSCVAMQFEISDDAALTFAEEFYTAIADGLPVEAAVSSARRARFTNAASTTSILRPNLVITGTSTSLPRSSSNVGRARFAG